MMKKLLWLLPLVLLTACHSTLHPPIPGSVTLLHVSAGEEVTKGDRLLVLEAMKMQTTLYAPTTGTVKEVCVKTRDTVEAHDLLMVIG